MNYAKVYAVKYDFISKSTNFSDALAICSSKKRAKEIILELLQNLEESLDDSNTGSTTEYRQNGKYIVVETTDKTTYKYYCVEYLLDELDRFK